MKELLIVIIILSGIIIALVILQELPAQPPLKEGTTSSPSKSNEANKVIANAVRPNDRIVGQAISPEPAQAMAAYQQGISAYAGAKYSEALQAFDEAEKLGLKDASLWYYRTTALKTVGRYTEALAVVNKALVLDPNNFQAWDEKVSVQALLKQYDSAMKTCENALRIQPQAINIAINKVIILEIMGRQDEALKYTNERILPLIGPIFYRMKGTLENNVYARYDSAVKSLDKAMEREPNSAELCLVKAQALSALKRYKEAIAACDVVIKLKPFEQDGWYTKAKAIYEQGNYDSALKIYNQAKEINLEKPNIWYGIACCYAHRASALPASGGQSDKKSTLRTLARAIRLEPQYKSEAKKDEVFKWLWSDQDFQNLTQ